MPNIFQLTSSRRGWPFRRLFRRMGSDISTHILTKRMTVNLTLSSVKPTFQLTSSRRGWPRGVAKADSKSNFNSHPHEEDDQCNSHIRYAFLFQLTSSRRGWRSSSGFTSLSFSISTHILTKRMTRFRQTKKKNQAFQLTSSRRGWPVVWVLHTGKRIFQLTSSRRGWRLADSTSTPARSFQLTSSRRGWRHYVVIGTT